MKIPHNSEAFPHRTVFFRAFARGGVLGFGRDENVSKWATISMRRPGEAAFTLVEILVSTCVFAVMAVALYAGISFGFTSITLARQNLRATQIALEKMEIVRMYSWEQINSNGFVPTNFTAPFYPAITGDTNGGLVYYGKTIISPFPKSISYSNDVRMVTVTLNWTNRTVGQSLEMSTYVSQYGMQRFIY